MIDNQIDQEIDIGLILKHFYQNRRHIFRVLILSIILSVVFSVARFLLSTPVYTYTSQSVIDMTVEEDATYQKSMFISYLGSQIIFDESAKSINLDASYALWRDSIVIESIVGTNQIVYKISSTNSDKLVELNRRIVSNTISQSSMILTGINVQTLEEAKLLDDVQEKRVNIDFVSNLLILTMFGLLCIFGLLTLQVLSDRKIKRPRDIQNHTGLAVIGTIPDFDGFSLSEEINLKNFVKGLIWKKKK